MAVEIEETIVKMNHQLKVLGDQATSEQLKQSFFGEMEVFKDLFQTYIKKKVRPIEWEKIRPPPESSILKHGSLEVLSKPEEISALLKKVAVVKLNGGLGTTMGCTGPKSVIEVTSDLTFLDLIVKQIQTLNKTYNANVPLILMNSFNTHEETQQITTKYADSIRCYSFNQSQYPRIFKESSMPVPSRLYHNKSEWYPPGHGDFYPAFYASGIMKQLQAEGIEFVFVSNVDNLGATVDLAILNHMSKHGIDFIMEVTDKTLADVKGGTLIDYEGGLKLLEIAQVPSSKVDEFKSIKKFKIFNTNNLWCSLSGIENLVKNNLMTDMDIILNYKVENGQQVLQIERAAGAAIQYFPKSSLGINVPRSRFLPVKSTSDLFVVQSNLYSLTNDGELALNPKRIFPTIPVVKLGEEFKKVGDYMSRISNIPDIVELDHLTVSGDVTFGNHVVLRGTVIIVANKGCRIDIPSGTTLENKVVSGNLRILVH